MNEPGVCHDCGADDEPLWDAGRCPSCTLAARLDKLFGDDTKRAANGLGDLHDALLNAPSPRSVLDSLRRTKSGHLLSRIANGDVACSHDALDNLPVSRSVENVRHLLVAVAVLPQRDPALARLERWINEFLAGIDDPDHAAVLRRYARWRILRPIRLKAETAPVIQIPHPLDDHLRELVNNPSVAGTVRLPITNWLFPSARAQGRPIGPLAISKRLKRLDIIAEQFRQAALYQLAAQLPTVVVADLLGISIKSAEQWASAAGRDQVDYLRLRVTAGE